MPAPPRGATAAHTAISACPAPIFQFPPLREGRPGAVAHRVNRRISIPAPPRGATNIRAYYDENKYISIPAPPRGATARMFSREPTIVISIPAPPRGATWFAIAPPTTSDFNSRPSARGDRSVLDAFLFSVFQFPPLREGRRFGRPLRAATCTFQFPPLREGRPARRQEEPLDGQIFQFPPLREGRLNGHNISGVFPYISIPAPPRGATADRANHYLAASFQFPPLREGRRGFASCGRNIQRISIPAPPRGARQKICNFCKSFVQPLQISMA